VYNVNQHISKYTLKILEHWKFSTQLAQAHLHIRLHAPPEKIGKISGGSKHTQIKKPHNILTAPSFLVKLLQNQQALILLILGMDEFQNTTTTRCLYLSQMHRTNLGPTDSTENRKQPTSFWPPPPPLRNCYKPAIAQPIVFGIWWISNGASTQRTNRPLSNMNWIHAGWVILTKYESTTSRNYEIDGNNSTSIILSERQSLRLRIHWSIHTAFAWKQESDWSKYTS
jgi:hypothetical protein